MIQPLQVPTGPSFGILLIYFSTILTALLLYRLLKIATLSLRDVHKMKAYRAEDSHLHIRRRENLKSHAYRADRVCPCGADSRYTGRTLTKFSMDIMPLYVTSKSYINFLQSVIPTWRTHELVRWERH
jgi:hypothetical protein